MAALRIGYTLSTSAAEGADPVANAREAHERDALGEARPALRAD